MNPNTNNPGRPRRWGSEAQKHREHRARRGERKLLHSVRNARVDDPALHQVAQHGDDADLLRALIGYYRARHWCEPDPHGGRA